MKFLRNIANDMYLRRPPAWMVLTAIVLVIFSWLPLVYIARMRTNPDSRPPIQLFQGMFHQPRYDAQEINPVFADRRAMREPVAGTVARGALIDPHFNLGYQVDGDLQPVTQTDDQGLESTVYFDGFPEQIELTEAFLKRGRQRYDIYCYPCHGAAGYGDGPINQRATELSNTGPAAVVVWTPASNLHAVGSEGELLYGEQVYPAGKMFNIISHGIRNMPAYDSQIRPIDRWAIVAYVHALQLSQRAPESAVPAEQRDALRAAGWAVHARQQVTPAESALRMLTGAQARAQRAADEATVGAQAEAAAEAQRIAGLVEQANQQVQVVREAAQAAADAAEQDDLAGARAAGERAVAAAEQVRQLQQQATAQPEDGGGDASDAGEPAQTGGGVTAPSVGTNPEEAE